MVLVVPATVNEATRGRLPLPLASRRASLAARQLRPVALVLELGGGL